MLDCKNHAVRGYLVRNFAHKSTTPYLPAILSQGWKIFARSSSGRSSIRELDMLKSKLPFGLLQECVYKNLPFSRPWDNPNPDLGERRRSIEDAAQQNRADAVASLVTAPATALTLERHDVSAIGTAASMGFSRNAGWKH
jgi:hypothetical protein